MNTMESDVNEITARSAKSVNEDAGLLTRLFDDVTGLVRSELSLAKSEVREAVTDAKTGVASVGVGLAILVPGITLLIISLVLMLEAFTGMALWSSTLLVGLIVTVLGAVMLATAKSKLSADNLRPSRTEEALKKNTTLVKRKLS